MPATDATMASEQSQQTAAAATLRSGGTDNAMESSELLGTDASMADDKLAKEKEGPGRHFSELTSGPLHLDEDENPGPPPNPHRAPIFCRKV
ncbi:hypothetical protein HPB50_004279 [Hyalomma asiaticum]|uniref:Uncharacterized protein n=1 Tax=Hyalomma asiaticum TaxID=266040 RepID=A0ACB7TEZ2_HYAAI|nr:hypothetical protein HPB50_004279 [Hyalomma asiaticum]